MSNEKTVLEITQDDERAWRRHEMRMYLVMALILGLVAGVIGVVLGGTMNGAEDQVMPAVQALDLDRR